MEFTTTGNPKRLGPCYKCGQDCYVGIPHYCPTNTTVQRVLIPTVVVLPASQHIYG